MSGIILIVLGIIFLTVGIIILTKRNENQIVETVRTIKQENADTVKKLVDTVRIVNQENSVEKMIDIAVADGFLSENEKTQLTEYANKNSLDANKILNLAQQKISKAKGKQEVEKIDYSKKNGNDFEGFIVKKFNPKYYTIKNWRGDKYIEGQYAEDTPDPDLFLEFKLKDEVSQFAVECKWRANYYKNGFEIDKNDFEKYQKFEQEKNIPVFMAIGIGGTGANPEKLFIVKLSSIKYNFLSKKFLTNFEKKDMTQNFYFDNQKITLH